MFENLIVELDQNPKQIKKKNMIHENIIISYEGRELTLSTPLS